MDTNKLKQLLEAYKKSNISIDDALKKLKSLPFEDLEYATVDHHREIRTGYPEVIYCEGKSINHLEGIIREMTKQGQNILCSRISREQAQHVCSVFSNAEYHQEARVVVLKQKEILFFKQKILILTAGTADIPVAEEASVTAAMMGGKTERLYDAGVAGIHRLLLNKEKLDDCAVIIVVAGMEGALPSVVGGLVDKPVIAVPTSIGYGTSFGGITPLLAMLNSCANGIGVVNIDNGFGAAYLAVSIVRQIEKGGDS